MRSTQGISEIEVRINPCVGIQCEDVANTPILAGFRILYQSIDRVMIENIESCLAINLDVIVNRSRIRGRR